MGLSGLVAGERSAMIDPIVPERDMILDYLLFREAWAAEHGLAFEVFQSWDGFAPLFEDLGEQTAFEGYAEPMQGFWVKISHNGKPMATYASYWLPLLGNLREHVERRGWYNGATDTWAFKGDAVALAEAIEGAVMFNGGIAVDHRYRRNGDKGDLGLSGNLSTVLPEMGRVIGYGLFAVPGSVFMIKPEIHTNAQNAKPQGLADGVDWFRDGRPYGPRRLLGWTSTPAALSRAFARMR